MKVLLTGAFGNLGSLVLEQLLENGHEVCCFDIESPVNIKVAKGFTGRCSIIWGDIRDTATVAEAVNGQEAIIHLAAIIYPFSENNPEFATQVNVQGTQNLIDAAEKLAHKPIFLLASSIAVFGITQNQPPPRTASDELVATDTYSANKIECEKRLKASTLDWSILRIAGMVDSRMRHSNKQQMKLAFAIAENNRIEFLHPKDGATAFANAVSTPEVLGKVLLLGGGQESQVTHYDFVNVMSSAMGLSFPKSFFGQQNMYTDWLDTEEAQRLLNFQHNSFIDLHDEAFTKFKWIRLLVKPISPLIMPFVKFYLK